MRHIGQQPQLIWLDCRDHFTGLRINHPDRRSRTLGPVQLFKGTPEGDLCFFPISRRLFLARTLRTLFCKKACRSHCCFTRRNARRYLKPLSLHLRSNSCPAVVLKRMPFCGSSCIVMAVPVPHQSFRFGKLGTQRCAAPNQVHPAQFESATSTRRTWGTLDARCRVIANWVGPGAWRHPLPFAGGKRTVFYD